MLLRLVSLHSAIMCHRAHLLLLRFLPAADVDVKQEISVNPSPPFLPPPRAVTCPSFAPSPPVALSFNVRRVSAALPTRSLVVQLQCWREKTL